MAYNQQPPGFPHQRHPAAPQAGSWQPAPYGQFPAAPVGYAVPPGGYYAPPAAAPMGYAGRPAMPMQPQMAPGPYAAPPGPSPSPTASPAPSFPPTAFGQGGDPFAAIANNPLANLGLQYVHQNLLPSKVGWLHYFSFSHLKYYFSVSNSYVLNKIKVLLCPFAHRNWKREEIAHPSASLDADGTPHVYYRPPKEDINAPDLYIPMMAFITYILLMGLALGMYHRFTPEVLSIIASSAMVTLLLEVGVMRFGFYMVGTVQTPSMFDLVAYCAYKYVGLLVDLAVGILVGSNLIFYGVVIVNAFFASVFTLRTVKRALTPSVTSGISEDDGANARRSYFLLLLAVVQFLSSMFLVKNAIPSPVS